MYRFFTFGSAHNHVIRIDNKVEVELNKDVIVRVKREIGRSARTKLNEIIGDQWSFEYDTLIYDKIVTKNSIPLNLVHWSGYKTKVFDLDELRFLSEEEVEKHCLGMLHFKESNRFSIITTISDR